MARLADRGWGLLAELNLTPLAHAPGHAVGGERRRALGARHLPKFILLDEPFAGIDPIAVTDIEDHLSPARPGIGVLVTDTTSARRCASPTARIVPGG
jgi:lipopolysaccharide export system ATP-binding protein